MIVLQLSLVSIFCFALMRGVLLIRAWPHIDSFSSAWLYIFGQGLIYDIAFISYFYISSDIPTRATFSEKISLVLISKAVP